MDLSGERCGDEQRCKDGGMNTAQPAGCSSRDESPVENAGYLTGEHAISCEEGQDARRRPPEYRYSVSVEAAACSKLVGDIRCPTRSCKSSCTSERYRRHSRSPGEVLNQVCRETGLFPPSFTAGANTLVKCELHRSLASTSVEIIQRLSCCSACFLPSDHDCPQPKYFYFHEASGIPTTRLH